MSDSDDLLPSNVFSFKNENTTVCARGPNINTTNLTGLSFRNNMTSTIHMPRNFERQQYLDSGHDQRSMYGRREMSPPMSLHSDYRPRNFQPSYYPRGMSCQRSMINGRSGSPMSVRSIDSNASVATEIAMAFKNVNFNKYDLRVIKEAYNKFMKRKFRKKIEKRRNRRLFLKGHRRKSGYDSGELGSDSSISSDDCRSTSTALYKDNMSSCRSTKTDISEFRRSMKESNIYKDRTDSLRQNSFRNMFNVVPRNTSIYTQSKEQCLPPGTQKDRFRAGFPLPSQRFNQSLASISIPERQNMLDNSYLPKNHKDVLNQNKPSVGDGRHETDSEQEEIFSGMSLRENLSGREGVYQSEPQNTNVTDQRKRSLESADHRLHNNKKSKMSSPKRNETEATLQKETGVFPKGNKKANEFQFVKPQLPLRKSGNAKMPKEVKEKLLAKSAPPLTDMITPASHMTQISVTAPIMTQTQPSKHKAITLNNDKEETCSNDQPDETLTTQLSTTDVSMRPSFIKRKLYTQKLDVMESKNLSSDNIAADSPQTNIYSAIQKEKNKARKLVTNQSCLSRDVQQEDNNLLDLIHKIVPPDRMNVTNKSDVFNNNSKNKLVKDDKWDVTSIISTCNNDDVSDTYTDEEIFKIDNNKTKTKKTKTPEKKSKEPKILVDKLIQNNATLPEPIKPNASMKNKDGNKKGNLYNCVKSFWDTDLESDLESNTIQNWKHNQKENYYQGNFSRHSSLNHTKGPDMDYSKVVPNDKSKSTTLTTNNIINHVKKLNLSLSLMKKTRSDANRVEPCLAKETKKIKESTKDKISNIKTDKEKKDKEIVSNKGKDLDSLNSLSKAIPDKSIKSNNTKCMPQTKNNMGEKYKKRKNNGLDNVKLITEPNKKSTNLSVTKSNTKDQVKKKKMQSPKAKIDIKSQEPKNTKQTQRASNKSKVSTKPNKEIELVAKTITTNNKKVNSKDVTQNESIETSVRLTRASLTKCNNNSTVESDIKKDKNTVDSKLTSDKGTKSRGKSKGNIKPQAESTTAIDCIAKRKTARTPKGFRCCVVLTPNTDDIKISKTSGRELNPKVKKTLSHMKTFLDNNNSTLSDGTLDEILKQNSVARRLRSTKNKVVVTPNTRSRTAGNSN